jgi:very-short-patch-repair endonuclease
VDSITEVFARQHGLVTAAQARALGVTVDGVRHRCRSGRWERLGHGVFRLAGSPSTRAQAVLAAVLAAGEPAWASHFTSLVLWAYRGFDAHPLEVCVPLERRPRVTGVRVHRSGTLEPGDVAAVDGIPVLTAARALVDTSARFDDAALGALVDDGLRRRVLTLGVLHAMLHRLPTIAPGRSPARLERVLRPRTGDFEPGDSQLERRVYAAIVAAGLPTPRRQHRVVVGERTYFLDLAYPDRRLAIEVDGFDFHRGRAVFDRDRLRQNDLVGAGWTVVRFTSTSTDAEIVATLRPLVFGR